MMSGIIFLKTRNLEQIKDFYLNQLEMSIWQDQGDCLILKKGNLLLGFCQREELETAGVITFFYPSMEEVDLMYRELQERAVLKDLYNS